MRMLGKWILPWRGEKLVAHIAALEGAWIRCQCLNGDRFLILAKDAAKLVHYATAEQAKAQGSFDVALALGQYAVVSS